MTLWTRRVGGGVVEMLAPTREAPTGSDASFIASTDAEARDGDILDQATWRLGDYLANPVILDNHDMRSVVGRSTRVGVEPVGLTVDVQWDTADVNPRGQLVAHQHDAGFRRAVSVRWIPGRTVKRNELPTDDPRYSEGKVIRTPWGDVPQVGRVMYDNTLLEVSSVSVPSDPHALQTRGLDLSPEMLDRMSWHDSGAASAIEQAAASALGPDELDTVIRDAVLHLVRSDLELRTALRALGLAETPPMQPAHPLAALFPTRR